MLAVQITGMMVLVENRTIPRGEFEKVRQIRIIEQKFIESLIGVLRGLFHRLLRYNEPGYAYGQ